MSVEASKPVDVAAPTEAAAAPAPSSGLKLTEVTPSAPAAETAPAAAADPVAAEPTPVAEESAPAAEIAAAPTTEEAPVAAAATETTAETKKPVEPITAGNLRYKAPANFPKNLLNQAQSLYFWFGDEVATEAQHFNQFLSSAKSDYARHAVAWSSQTGKGLLYYGKTKDNKETPSGVLPLSDASNISSKGYSEFFFELGGHKHVFIASSEAEREGWLASLKAEAEAASGKKEEIHGSEGFKKALDDTKPAVAAASVAPKKSVELDRAARSESKDKSKSRSLSRGKRGIFDRLSGKKEEAKEEPAAAEASATPAAVETTPTETTLTEPAAVDIAPAAAAVEEPTAEEAKVEEPKAEGTPMPRAERRSSRLGDFLTKLRSPTQEKKEADLVPPPVAATEPEAEASTSEVAPVADFAAPAALETGAVEPLAEPEASKAVDSPTTGTATPTKEKKRFFELGKFLPKDKSKATDKSPVVDAAPTATETPAVAAETPAVTEPATTEPEIPAATETPAVEAETSPAATPAAAAPVSEKDSKRRSAFFSGDLAGSIKKLGKSEKRSEPAEASSSSPTAESSSKPTADTKLATGETSKSADSKKENPLSQLGRRVSTAFRGGKRDLNKENVAPTKIETAGDPVGESSSAGAAADVPATEEPVEKAEEAKTVDTPTAPHTIGDVVPEAVTIGTAPPAAPAVQASA